MVGVERYTLVHGDVRQGSGEVDVVTVGVIGADDHIGVLLVLWETFGDVYGVEIPWEGTNGIILQLAGCGLPPQPASCNMMLLVPS